MQGAPIVAATRTMTADFPISTGHVPRGRRKSNLVSTDCHSRRTLAIEFWFDPLGPSDPSTPPQSAASADEPQPQRCASTRALSRGFGFPRYGHPSVCANISFLDASNSSSRSRGIRQWEGSWLATAIMCSSTRIMLRAIPHHPGRLVRGPPSRMISNSASPLAASALSEPHGFDADPAFAMQGAAIVTAIRIMMAGLPISMGRRSKRGDKSTLASADCHPERLLAIEVFGSIRWAIPALTAPPQSTACARRTPVPPPAPRIGSSPHRSVRQATALTGRS
jgi:hypothetical protein